MPFQVVKENDKFRLKKIKEGTYVKTLFKSKESAINAAKNYMRYRHETPIVKGNKILAKQK